MKLKNILLAFFNTFFSGNILSHQKSQSYTSWKGEVSGTDFAVTVSTKISKGVLFNQLQNNGYRIDQLENYFKNKINSEDCFSQNPLIQEQSGNFVKYLYMCICSVLQPRFNFILFFDFNLSHLDFSSQQNAGQLFPEFIISSDNRQISIFGENQSAEINLSFLNFLSFGFKHILSGLDHIAFLLLIIFLCTNLKTLFFAISGFTLGHSASLFSSVQGLIVLQQIWLRS